MMDKTLYMKLLIKSKSLRDMGKSLSDENYQEFRRLLSYQVILEDQIRYNRKTEYIFLIADYLGETIGPVIFRFMFIRMRKEDTKARENLEKNFQQLAAFSIDSKSIGFSDPINQIVTDCEKPFDFDPIDEENPEYGISEKVFQDLVIKNCLKMQKYFN